MVDIIRLHGDPHAQSQRLLPWYVNGSLEGEELAQVETHLADCAECREDLKAEEAMARQIRTLPSDADRGWTALKAKVEGGAQAQRQTAGHRLFGRRVSLGWAVLAQAACLALVIPIVALTISRPQPLYRTLGSAPTAESGNLVVIFKPETSEQALRTTLTHNGARIVDGPTSTDAYVLHVPAGKRAEVLARLKSDHGISLAEAIDGDAR